MSPEAFVLALAAEILGMLIGVSVSRGNWAAAYVLSFAGWGLIWYVMKISGVTA